MTAASHAHTVPHAENWNAVQRMVELASYL